MSFTATYSSVLYVCCGLILAMFVAVCYRGCRRYAGTSPGYHSSATPPKDRSCHSARAECHYRYPTRSSSHQSAHLTQFSAPVSRAGQLFRRNQERPATVILLSETARTQSSADSDAIKPTQKVTHLFIVESVFESLCIGHTLLVGCSSNSTQL